MNFIVFINYMDHIATVGIKETPLCLLFANNYRHLLMNSFEHDHSLRRDVENLADDYIRRDYLNTHCFLSCYRFRNLCYTEYSPYNYSITYTPEQRKKFIDDFMTRLQSWDKNCVRVGYKHNSGGHSMMFIKLEDGYYFVESSLYDYDQQIKKVCLYDIYLFLEDLNYVNICFESWDIPDDDVLLNNLEYLKIKGLGEHAQYYKQFLEY